MRKINTGDVFKTARLLKYSGVKEIILSKFEEAKNLSGLSADDPKIKEFGSEVIFTLIDALADAEVEREFYDLIGGITEKDNIAEQPFTNTWEDLKQIAKENDLQNFFSLVSKASGATRT